ncbi:uncharacterized protein [Branchiostoma lanceolatum]|uniref:uncharacterized protein n=1 Tax=Branchiostoma lanceolatum TaxID=7740 RepID=UPI003456DC8C
MLLFRRRRKTALLLVAALLLVMELSRKRLLPTALWSREEPGIVWTERLQQERLVDDAMNNVFGRQALGSSVLSNELTDNKTNINLSRQASTNDGLNRMIPGSSINNTTRTQATQNDSLHARPTNGNANSTLIRQDSTNEGLSKMIPGHGGAISDTLRTQATQNDSLHTRPTKDNTNDTLLRQSSSNDGLSRIISGGAINNTLRTQAPTSNTFDTGLTKGNASDTLRRQAPRNEGLGDDPNEGTNNSTQNKQAPTNNVATKGLANGITNNALSGHTLVKDSLAKATEDSLRKREAMENGLAKAGGALADSVGRQTAANDVLANNRWKSANKFKGSNGSTRNKTFDRREALDSGPKITSTKGQEQNTFGITSKTCTKKTNLVFLKTHKTASSTVQNIIMRFGSARSLTFALPSKRTSNLGWPQLFKKSHVLQERLGRKNTSYNILCHHTRLNYDNIRELMPDDTVYITIVRNPADMYESIFYYMGLDKHFKINSTNPLRTFLEKPSYYVYKNRKAVPQLYRNPMFYDLGYLRTQSVYVSEQTIKSDIDRLEKIFSLVMVADYFEESLVLMKHALCWDIDDVTFFKLNARREESIRHVTRDMAGKIRRWNMADAMLFDHFNKTLWSKLSQLPFDWRKEVAVLKARNRRLQEDCIESDRVRNAEIQDKRFQVYQPAGITIKGFQLKESARMNQTCVNMAKSEIPFTFELQDKVSPKYFRWDTNRKFHNHFAGSSRRKYPSIYKMHSMLKQRLNHNVNHSNQNSMVRRNLPSVFQRHDREKPNLIPNHPNQNIMAQKKLPSISKMRDHEKENDKYPNQNLMEFQKKLHPIFDMHGEGKQKPNSMYSNQNAMAKNKVFSILEMRDKEKQKPDSKYSNQNLKRV